MRLFVSANFSGFMNCMCTPHSGDASQIHVCTYIYLCAYARSRWRCVVIWDRPRKQATGGMQISTTDFRDCFKTTLSLILYIRYECAYMCARGLASGRACKQRVRVCRCIYVCGYWVCVTCLETPPIIPATRTHRHLR